MRPHEWKKESWRETERERERQDGQKDECFSLEATRKSIVDGGPGGFVIVMGGLLYIPVIVIATATRTMIVVMVILSISSPRSALAADSVHDTCLPLAWGMNDVGMIYGKVCHSSLELCWKATEWLQVEVKCLCLSLTKRSVAGGHWLQLRRRQVVPPTWVLSSVEDSVFPRCISYQMHM